jgi:hypothetical protein
MPSGVWQRSKLLYEYYPTRALAQVALDDRAKAHDWTDLRKPKVRKWRCQGGIIFAMDVDLGNSREHWMPVQEWDDGMRTLPSEARDTFHHQSDAEFHIASIAVRNGWTEITEEGS